VDKSAPSLRFHRRDLAHLRPMTSPPGRLPGLSPPTLERNGSPWYTAARCRGRAGRLRPRPHCSAPQDSYWSVRSSRLVPCLQRAAAGGWTGTSTLGRPCLSAKCPTARDSAQNKQREERDIEMRFITLILKGIAVGISNVIPGVSTGTFLLLLGIYDELLEAVGNFLTNSRKRKDYLLFLIPVGIGAAAGTLGFANVITLLLDGYPVPTQFFFIGLVVGGIPAVLRMHFDMRPTFGRLAALLLGVSVILILGVGDRLNWLGGPAAAPRSASAFLYFVFAGLLAGGAMVTPGMSGSYLFLLTGTYQPIMLALKSLTTPPVLWTTIASVSVGAASGILLCSRLIAWALRRMPALTYYLILGMICGSFYGLWPSGRVLQPGVLLISCGTFLGATVASYWLGREPSHPMSPA
jgi:putative membrane protein